MLRRFATSLLLAVSIVTASTLFTTEVTAAPQRTITVHVVDADGRPAAGVTVFAVDGYTCSEGVSNRRGKVVFEVTGEDVMIYAADLSGRDRFGPIAHRPMYSADEYRVVLPAFPRTRNEAAEILDRFAEGLALAFDLASVADLGGAIAQGREALVPSYLGVPSVFSVSPIPRVDEQTGRVVLVISGRLVEPIVKIPQAITGRHYVYVGAEYADSY